MRRTPVALVVAAVLTLTGFIIAKTAPTDQLQPVFAKTVAASADEASDPISTIYLEVSHTPELTPAPTPAPDP
jgi:hypothetical protein